MIAARPRPTFSIGATIPAAHRTTMIMCGQSWARKHGMTYYVVLSSPPFRGAAAERRRGTEGDARYILTARPDADETVLLTILPTGEVH
jgi:hypothetical protein